MMQRVVFLLIVGCAGAPAPADDWPQFRGPAGDGHAAGRDLPLTWSETDNIVWKVPIAGRGWSSPVIAGKQIWMTTALDEGRSLRAVCVHRETGRLLHDIEVFQESNPGKINPKNSYASPTPVLDGNRVYVHFGAYGTACVSTEGKIIWRVDGWKYNHGHGPGGSPILYKDLLIFNCDGTDVQFVVALDARTGRIRWKQARSARKGRMAYATPQLIQAGGRAQVISPGGNQVVSYDPATGEEIWQFRYTGYSVVPRPVYGHGLVFFSCGFDNAVLYAVRPDGHGDVTDTHLAWKRKRGAPYTPSPLLVGDELYVVSDKGIASCVDARTGKQHWQKRLGGGFSASPVFADGRIYFLNEAGVATVIAPGKVFKKLATNEIDGRTLASLAVVGRRIYLRSDTHLYRIEKPPNTGG